MPPDRSNRASTVPTRSAAFLLFPTLLLAIMGCGMRAQTLDPASRRFDESANGDIEIRTNHFARLSERPVLFVYHRSRQVPKPALELINDGIRQLGCFELVTTHRNQLPEDPAKRLELTTQLANPAGYTLLGQFEITDPVEDEVLYDVRVRATNWDGMAKPVLYPAINRIADWLEENGCDIGEAN